MTKDQILTRLTAHLPSADIEVFDLTGGEDHWEVTVQAPQFKGLSRIQQHQLVMEPFQVELKSGELHALALKTKIKE
jgi:stress-induced morphogen